MILVCKDKVNFAHKMDSPRLLRYATNTAQEKLNIVEVAKELGNSKAAKLYHIPLTNLKRWRKMESFLKLQIGNKQIQLILIYSFNPCY